MTSDLSNLKVLVVEDSPTQALLIQEILKKNKMSVSTAGNGIEGMMVLEEKQIDIVISDIEMPQMNGYDLCRIIKAHERYKNIPVILLTKLKDPKDAILGIECGANSFLTKPCNPNVLISTIKNTIKNKALSDVDRPSYNMEFFFEEERHIIKIDQLQITELLLSSYTNAVQKNIELESAFIELNQLYGELKRKNSELSALNNQKNIFLGMAAHDIRNPLGAINSFCELLLSQDKHFDGYTTKIINHIHHASRFMLNLINAMLDISVIESGIVKLNISQVDIPKLIKEAIELLGAVAEKKNIQISFQNKSEHSTISCDRDKILQVITNLLTNAIKFSYPESSIEVVLESSPYSIIISVTDHGTGISEDTQKRMFQAFQKGEHTGTKGEVGTGLGLAIVHKIVAEHKGTIKVESTLQKGSTFYVTLPIQANIEEK